MFTPAIIVNTISFNCKNLKELFSLRRVNSLWNEMIEKYCEKTWQRMYTQKNFEASAKLGNMLFLDRFLLSYRMDDLTKICDKFRPFLFYYFALDNHHNQFAEKFINSDCKPINLPVKLVATFAALYANENILIPLLEEKKIGINDCIDEAQTEAYFYGDIPYGERKLCNNNADEHEDLDEDLPHSYFREMKITEMNFFYLDLYHLVIESGNIDLVRKILKYKPNLTHSGEDNIWASCIDHSILSYGGHKDPEFPFQILDILQSNGKVEYFHMLNLGELENEYVGAISEFWIRTAISLRNLSLDYHEEYDCDFCRREGKTRNCIMLDYKSKLEHKHNNLPYDLFFSYFDKLVQALKYSAFEICRLSLYFEIPKLNSYVLNKYFPKFIEYCFDEFGYSEQKTMELISISLIPLPKPKTLTEMISRHIYENGEIHEMSKIYSKLKSVS